MPKLTNFHSKCKKIQFSIPPPRKNTIFDFPAIKKCFRHFQIFENYCFFSNWKSSEILKFWNPKSFLSFEIFLRHYYDDDDDSDSFLYSNAIGFLQRWKKRREWASICHFPWSCSAILNLTNPGLKCFYDTDVLSNSVINCVKKVCHQMCHLVCHESMSW